MKKMKRLLALVLTLALSLSIAVTTSFAVDVVKDPVAGTAYKFGMVQENVSATDVYYLTGKMALNKDGTESFYMATTTDTSAAVDVYLETAEGGYYLYAMVDGSKKYINMVVSGNYVNGKYEDTASTVYSYDQTNETVVSTQTTEKYGESEYRFGTSSKTGSVYTTVGPTYSGFYCKFYCVEHVAEEYGCYQFNDDGSYTVVYHCATCGCDSGVIVNSIEQGSVQDHPFYISDQNYDTSEVEYAAKITNANNYFSGRGLGGTILTFTAPEGVTVTVDGVEVTSPVVMPTPMYPGMPSYITITNAGDAEVMDLVFTYPVGTYQNPDELKADYNGIANNTATSEGSGYNYEWIAPADGELTVAVSGEEGWTYVVNNLGGDPDDWSDDQYGSTHYSDDTPLVDTETVTVKAGDVVEVAVTGYNPYAYLPAANVVVTATFVCAECNIVVDAAVDATCTTSGLTEGKHCDVCGKVEVAQTVVDALGHTEVVDAAIAATCTTSGLTEGKHCSVCNEVLVAQTVVDALGHTEAVDAAVAPTCTTSGLTEGKHCSVCNKVLVTQTVVDALGHTEVVDAAVAPTCTETGLTEGSHCDACGEVFVAQEVVDALGHDMEDGVCTICGYDESPKTGDTAPVMAVLALGLAAAAASVVLTKKRRA